MLPIIRTLLLAAGISGAMAFLAPAAHAIDPLVLEAVRPSAHDGDDVRAVGFAADGLGGDWIFSGGEDAKLRRWDLALGPVLVVPVLTLDHTVYDLEPSLDGSFVVTGEGGWNGGTDSDTLRIWDADGFVAGTGAPIGFVYVVTISHNNSFIAASGFYGQILVYDTTSLTLCTTKETGNKRTKAIAFSPDGTILAATWKGGTIQLFSFSFNDESCELVLLPVSMNHGGTWDLSLAFWPGSDSDMTKIVSGTDSGMVKVWTILDPDGSSTVTVEAVPSGGVRSLAWSPDGSMIVAGGNGDITVYDADTLGILSQEVNAHAGRVNDVAFSPDSSKIASGGNDGALKLWQAPVPAVCSVDSCDDSNECTDDECVSSICQNTLLPDNSLCNGGSGICCSGSCGTAACSDSDACIPTHTKEKGPRCSDGLDNDCDYLIDEADPDC